MAKNIDLHALAAGILAGKMAALSRAITLVESTLPMHQTLSASLMNLLLPYTGKSIRIGITGVPGVGKSTFIEAFGMHVVKQGYKLAVLAIDPSSTVSKGSILGDKTRMEQLAIHPNAFIRPSAAAGSLGGLAFKTREAMLLCEAAGYDVILIETVGVGQSETAVSNLCDFFLLLMLAGAGDELQGIKRGIMEMADGLIITKADGDNLIAAKNARAAYARALHYFPPHASAWTPLVQIASAYENTGIQDVWQMIEQFKVHQQDNAYWQKRRSNQNILAYEQLLHATLLTRLYANIPASLLINIQQDVAKGTLSTYSAVQKIMDTLSANA